MLQTHKTSKKFRKIYYTYFKKYDELCMTDINQNVEGRKGMMRKNLKQEKKTKK